MSNWNNRPTLNLERPTEARAFYRPSTDTVHMPMRNRFVDAERYYSTLFHELVHSTGHASRLNREFGLSFGDDPYSREELVAEMGAAFLCAIAGISNERTEKNTTAYLQNWITVLKGDSRLVVQAASQAQRAADMIAGISAEENDEGEGQPRSRLLDQSPHRDRSSINQDHIEKVGESIAYRLPLKPS